MRSTSAGLRILLALAVAGLLSCSDKSTEPVTDDLYPTIIRRVGPDSLATLNAEFAAANPGLCFWLDSYGLTTFAPPACVLPSAGISPSPDTTRLIQIAREMLVHNSRFTGVTSETSLTLRGLLRELAGVYQLTFDEQTYAGRPVDNTTISVEVDSVKVLRIAGHHYASIHIPSAVMPESDARARLIGYQIVWFDFGGGRYVFTITAPSFCGAADQAIVPFETPKGRELRVAWRIRVGVEGCSAAQSWDVYVDVITGEVLQTVQLFVT